VMSRSCSIPMASSTASPTMISIVAFLNGEIGVGGSWTIATGTEPIPDTPPQIIYHFDTDPLKIGTLTEDGMMDWKDRGRLPQVREGDRLAEKIPGPKGKEGMDVYGKKIPIPKLREQRFKCGKGARRSEDGDAGARLRIRHPQAFLCR
jgi:uncharacterized protein (DUF342 family)